MFGLKVRVCVRCRQETLDNGNPCYTCGAPCGLDTTSCPGLTQHHSMRRPSDCPACKGTGVVEALP